MAMGRIVVGRSVREFEDQASLDKTVEQANARQSVAYRQARRQAHAREFPAPPAFHPRSTG